MDLMTRRRAIMGMPSGKDYTVSGNVVSVSNALAKNAKSLVVSFSPQQNGSGDPSPNNIRPITGYNDIGVVRTGKNVFGGEDMADNITTNLSSATKNTTNKTVSFGYNAGSALATVISGGFFKPNTVYTLIFSALNATIARSNMMVAYTDGTSSIIGMTKTNEKETLRFVTNSSKSVSYIGLQRQGGTTVLYYEECGIFVGNVDASAFEPYISPVTANVHVGGAGKNKLNPATTSLTNSTVFGLAVTWSSDGVLHFSGTWTGATANSVRVLDVDPNVRSLAVKGFSTGHVSLRWQNGEDRIVADFTSMTNGSTYDITVWPMVYEGTAPTTYEPYSLFGGTVDLVSGECVVDKACMIFNGTQSIGLTNWRPNDASVGWLYRQEITPNINPTQIEYTNIDQYGLYCDTLKVEPYAGYGGYEGLYSGTKPFISVLGGSAWGIGMRMNETSLTTASAINAWLAAHPTTVVYPLATPITYQLTPSQLALLKGNNTVYSNEGSISLTYVGK